MHNGLSAGAFLRIAPPSPSPADRTQLVYGLVRFAWQQDFPDTFGGFASLGLLYACYAVAVYGLSEAVASAHASGIDTAGR